MLTLAAIALGVIIAAIGYKHGLYTMWAIMFNIVVGIYVGVMLSPTLASYFGMISRDLGNQDKDSFWYMYSACVAVVSFATFFMLQIIALTYFTGTFNITLPKLVNTIGSAFLGFITGYMLWGFICFVVIIMPVTHNNVLLKPFTENSDSRRISTPAVSKIVNTVGAFSFQPDLTKTHRVISWTLGWPDPEPAQSADK